jgi:hypothetical protein
MRRIKAAELIAPPPPASPPMRLALSTVKSTHFREARRLDIREAASRGRRLSRTAR